MSGNIPWSTGELALLREYCIAGMTSEQIHAKHLPNRSVKAINYKICEGRKSEPSAYPKHYAHRKQHPREHQLTREERLQMILDLHAKYAPHPIQAIS